MKPAGLLLPPAPTMLLPRAVLSALLLPAQAELWLLPVTPPTARAAQQMAAGALRLTAAALQLAAVAL